MKEKAKNIVIAVLVLVIVGGGYWSWNHQNKIEKVMSNSIHSNLRGMQYVLNDINEELLEKDLTSEEFNGLISKNFGHFDINYYAAHKYKKLNKSLDYIDMGELDSYLSELTVAKLSEKELEYHKGKLKEINSLIQQINLERSNNYLKPSTTIKQQLEKINGIAEESEKALK